MPYAFHGLDAFLLPVAFSGMVLLGLGALWRDENNHLVRIAGWLLFGLYWPFQAPEFLAMQEPVNAYLTLAAPLLTGYVAYQEYLSWRWGEQPVALRWLTGATFVAATSYFVLFEITPVQETVIYWTGVETSWVVDTFFGTNSMAIQAPQADPIEGYKATHICLANGYYSSVESQFCQPAAAGAGFPYYAVTIIFACTALQSIMIFVGGIGFTKAPWKRKLKAIGVIAPAIYVLNLFRNAGIIYGYRVQNWTLVGMESFELMHSVVFKAGSIVALVVLALYAFRVLPEMHENILDILALPNRQRADPPEEPPTPASPSS